MTDDAPKQPKKPAWRKLLKLNSDKVPYANELNVMTVLENAEEFKGALRYDSFSDQIHVLKKLPWGIEYSLDAFTEYPATPWSDKDRIELQAWLQLNGVMVNKSSVVQDAVIAVAKRNDYHPVREWLVRNAPSWDEKPRLTHWLLDYMGAKDNEQYLEAIGPAFFIGCVARIMDPGCQMDTTLVFEAPQGKRKSTAVRVIARGWNADLSQDLANKDAAIHIQGIWIAELSEMTALARSQVEVVKAFISRRKDRYRPPYGRNAEDRLRQTVFIATTNEVEYLQDKTGGRRFWPVDCGDIDLAALERDIEQLWAEAWQRWLKKEKWWLDNQTEVLAYREQQHRRRISPLEVDVMTYIDQQRAMSVTTLDSQVVAREALGITEKFGSQHGTLFREISQVMQAHGWVKLKPKGRTKMRRQMYTYDPQRDPDVVMAVENEESQGES